MDYPTNQKGSRRSFLSLAAGALTGGAALTLLRGKAHAETETVSPQHGNYWESQHIKTFYELARF